MCPRFVRTVAAACAALALFGCPKAPPKPPELSKLPSPEERLRSDVATLTARTASLLERQDELVWKNWTTGAAVDFSALNDEQQALFTLDALAKLDALLKHESGVMDQRALSVLRTHVAGEYLAGQVAPQTVSLSHLEAATTFKVGDREHVLRDVERLLARERNALRRQEIAQGSAKAIAGLTEALQARDARVREVLQQLGYPTPLAFSTDLRRADLEQLAKDAQRVLDVTEPAFRSVLEQLSARELRMPLDRVRPRDLPRMFRSRAVDDLFPKEAVAARVKDTLSGLGIDLFALPNLKVDDQDVPEKNARPLALAVKVPDDVRLSVKPLPGLRQQSGYLHEVGHALHAAFTKEPRFALARLGAGSVDEAWSEVFELLTEDPVWLQQEAGLKGERLDRYLAASAAWDLYLLRRSAGHLLYELALALGPKEQDAKALFGKQMSKALLVPFEAEDEARYLYEQEEFFGSAVTLEAAFLSHQVQAQLKARFGPSWWRSTDAGGWLKALWAHGHALNARELAKEAGEAKLSPDPLLLRLTSTLKLPIAVPGDTEDDADEP